MSDNNKAKRTNPVPEQLYKYVLTGEDQTELLKRFTYHAPQEGQPVRYEHLRNKAHELAAEIKKCTPPSREQSLALTHLDDVVMCANAAIARNE